MRQRTPYLVRRQIGLRALVQGRAQSRPGPPERVRRERRGERLDSPAEILEHGQRLFLIVRDEDEGDPQLELKPLEFGLHLLAELEV
jgi:hypothetical protein